MSDREAMKLALEALEWAWGGEPMGTKEQAAMQALRTALAALEDALEAQEDEALLNEPVAMRYDGDGYGYLYIDSGSGSDWQRRHNDAEPLYLAPPKPDATQEPATEKQYPEKGPALSVYNEISATDDPGSPLERLRFFCSLAMRPQDWLDVAPFFDAVAEPEKVTPSTPVQYGWLCPACGRGNAPLAQTCSCKGWPSLQITCGPATMTGGT